LSLALARKYRPSTFDDLVGQDAVSQTLSLALEGDRLSHAYLFSGLRGSGKTSTARIFAKALLCENGPTAKPCNRCDHCTMANESRHMDIIEMDAASNRGIDDIKELIEHTKYKPSTGRYKIFIIDEVHMLTTQAFNALLKTLEEPPDFVKFILATTDPLKLPATILSRTQHFRFKKIPQRLVVSHLQFILDTEGVAYDKEALEIIARSGAGSLRDSLTLLDQAIVYSKNHVDVATVTGMLGIIDPAKLDDLLAAIQTKNTEAILRFIKEAGEYETEMLIDELTLHLKEMFLSQDSRFSPLEIDRFFRILADAKDLLALGSDGEFVLSVTLFKMVEALSIRDIDAMIRALQKELSGVKVPEKTVTPQPEEREIDIAAVAPDVSVAVSASEDTRPTPTETVEAPPSQETETSSDEPSVQTDSDETAPLRFKQLIDKIYDRDYDLGSIFEANITFKQFRNGELTWYSAATGDEKKALIHGWSIIKLFVQEIFGVETRIVNIPAEPDANAKKKTDELTTDYAPSDPASPQETFDESGSTVASLTLSDEDSSDASAEKDPSTLLEEPMIQEMLKRFSPKKVRIVRKS
jgi:DNA polymerase-3 subunit gamma/tau